MPLLQVSGLSKYYGGDLIFSDIYFRVERGDKVALVGVNGAGKSTLLKIIAKVEDASQGGVHFSRGIRVAYLAQDTQFAGERTLWEEMESSLGYLNQLRAEMEALEHTLGDTDAADWEKRMERYGELSERFEHGGGYEVEHRIERVLHGLGFDEKQYFEPVARFSGGQKTRAALAAALLADPDVLLLDEPTNHLDLAALEWLEGFLKSWHGTLIVVSHDRYFLDKVTNRTLEVAHNRLDGDYPAGYNGYLQLKAERETLLLKQFNAQQEHIAKTEEFIRRFKNGSRAGQARGRERRLERLKEGWEGIDGRKEQLIDPPKGYKKVAFNMGTDVRAGELVLRLSKLAVGYGPGSRQSAVGSRQSAANPEGRMQKVEGSERDKRHEARDKRLEASVSGLRSPVSGRQVTLLRTPELEIHRGQRVALMGANGSGKTTLLRTIAGELPALGGRALLGHRVALNYYTQGHEGLRPEATVLDEIRRVVPGIKDIEARTLLGRFLFSGDDVFKRVGDLSGGERSRVALAQLTVLGGNLLVLDEPTNHLDIGAVEALEGVLRSYNGTLLFVSHDRSFIDAVADTIWMVRDGGIEVFNGTYSEYVAARTAQTQRERQVQRRDRAMSVA